MADYLAEVFIALRHTEDSGKQIKLEKKSSLFKNEETLNISQTESQYTTAERILEYFL